MLHNFTRVLRFVFFSSYFCFSFFFAGFRWRHMPKFTFCFFSRRHQGAFANKPSLVLSLSDSSNNMPKFTFCFFSRRHQGAFANEPSLVLSLSDSSNNMPKFTFCFFRGNIRARKHTNQVWSATGQRCRFLSKPTGGRTSWNRRSSSWSCRRS